MAAYCSKGWVGDLNVGDQILLRWEKPDPQIEFWAEVLEIYVSTAKVLLEDKSIPWGYPPGEDKNYINSRTGIIRLRPLDLGAYITFVGRPANKPAHTPKTQEKDLGRFLAGRDDFVPGQGNNGFNWL